MYEVGEDRYVTFYKMSALEFAAGCDLDYHQTLVGHIVFLSMWLFKFCWRPNRGLSLGQWVSEEKHQ